MKVKVNFKTKLRIDLKDKKLNIKKHALIDLCRIAL